MLEGRRGRSPPPAWDARIDSAIYNDTALAACHRAGFVLIRDVAPYTAQELIRDHRFTEYEADALHRELQGTDHREELSYGTNFVSLARMYIRDIEGGEGNADRAKQKLTEMFGRPIKNKADLATLKKQIVERTFAPQPA